MGPRVSLDAGRWTAARLDGPGFEHWCGQSRADRFDCHAASARVKCRGATSASQRRLPLLASVLPPIVDTHVAKPLALYTQPAYAQSSIQLDVEPAPAHFHDTWPTNLLHPALPPPLPSPLLPPAAACICNPASPLGGINGSGSGSGSGRESSGSSRIAALLPRDEDCCPYLQFAADIRGIGALGYDLPPISVAGLVYSLPDITGRTALLARNEDCYPRLLFRQQSASR